MFLNQDILSIVMMVFMVTVEEIRQAALSLPRV
jgi:hypothetical protein